MRRSHIVVLMGFLLGACGPGDGQGEVEVVVDSVAGVERLSYAASAAPPLGWTLDTLGVLGGAQVLSEEEQFEGVSASGLAGADDGTLYVLDGQGKRVLAFGPDGSFLRSYGREGEGPGELRSPSAVAVGPGDSVWVSDMGNVRATVFAPDGELGRSVPFPSGDQRPSGTLVVREDGFVQAMPTFAFRPGENVRPPIPIIRFAADGTLVDTLSLTPAPKFDQVTIEAGGHRLFILMAPAFTTTVRWVALPDGSVVVSDTAEYVLRWVGADGAPRRIVRRAPPARATTEADRERELERLREEGSGGMPLPGGPDPEQMLEQRLKNMTFAPVIPRITALASDPRGRVWVGVSEDVASETARVDVYASDGRLLGELRGIEVPALFYGGDRAAALRRDEMDVQQVVVLRVVEGARAGR